MSRTTINKVILATVVLGSLTSAGCSKKYAHKALDANGPVGQEVRAMAAALRSAGPGELEGVLQRQAATGLTSLQAKSLRTVLLQLAKAKEVDVEDVSQFGQNVYRASLRLRSAGGSSVSVCMLLVRPDGRLRWAGRN
ncbi:MAG: hypothetical protein MUP47_07650 [Phycisphaerae bacterium]|nr:hypothetical protein [Phycisphaerae bacterium]